MRRLKFPPIPETTPIPAVRTYAGPVVDQLVRGAEMDTPVSRYFLVKRGLDCVLAVAAAVVAVPVALVAMLVVRLTSRGPAIYTQTRVGYGGRPFTIYKIRTMIDNCESLTGPRWCVPDDPRVTPVGGVLRKLHIDELPQLWNVLRGDMSLVGPRPERPEFITKLERKIPHYQARHAVLPGITGLAQIFLPPDTEVAHVERKLVFDLDYARRQGLGLDLRILLCTALKLFGLPRAMLRSLVPVRGEAAVEESPRRLAA
jgi:lipopolysaccharide/colanic/teichoic acid biosynthesis glycosyltransferase